MWAKIKLGLKVLIFAGLVLHAITWIGSDEAIKQGFGMVLLALYYLIYQAEKADG